MQIMHQCCQHIMAASFSLTILTNLVQDEAVCQNIEVTFCECGITSRWWVSQIERLHWRMEEKVQLSEKYVNIARMANVKSCQAKSSHGMLEHVRSSMLVGFCLSSSSVIGFFMWVTLKLFLPHWTKALKVPFISKKTINMFSTWKKTDPT